MVEYPVRESHRHGPMREVTDLDALAFRFPGAESELIRNLQASRGFTRPSPLLHGEGPTFEPMVAAFATWLAAARPR
jgi:hypothetical protein